MFGIIGTIEAGAVIQGGGLAHAMMADEVGISREAEPVIWDNAEAMPEFEVIGYAVDRPQAVEVAHSFADSRGLVFVEIPRRSGAKAGAAAQTHEAARHVRHRDEFISLMETASVADNWSELTP
jgi:hypothetical protein